MAFTFRGGIHPPMQKELTENCAFLPPVETKELCVSLSQHIGAPAIPVVKEGDEVKRGQLIARAAPAISAPVHSPVSGRVRAIENRLGLFGDLSMHVVIENDFLETEDYLPPLHNPTQQQAIERITQAGIVGMGGAGFPTAAKLNFPVQTLVINAAECEPYLTCDYRLLLERTAEFLRGVDYLKLATGATRALICVENNKTAAIREVEKAGVPLVRFRKQTQGVGTYLVPLKTKYPQGSEKQIIYSATGKEVPEGALPSSLGIAVYNAHTAFSVYEAIELGKPLIERYMTLSGRAAKNPCNLLVKIGTPFALLAERCEASDTRMVVSGGPMMGFCSVSGEVCTKKTSGSLLFFTKEEVADSAAPVGACIGCGRCVSVCPMRLMPVMIDQSARAGNLKDAARYGAQQCMECGSCSYVCPAKRPLMQSIRGTKKKLREEKKRG